MTNSVRTAAASCLLVLSAATGSLAGLPWQTGRFLSGHGSAESVPWSGSHSPTDSGLPESSPFWLSHPTACDANSLGWTVTADALLLKRRTAQSRAILFTPAVNAADVVALNVSDLGFNFEPGFRIGLNRCLVPGWNIEVDYFGIDGWTSSVVRDGNPLILFPPAVMVSNQFAVDYGSDLDSAEVNLCHQFGDRLKLLAGLRWVELHEEFRVTGLSPSPLLVPRYTTQTGNSMYGLQIGLVEKFFARCGRWHFNSFFKAGVYANHAKQETATVGNATPLVTAGDRGNETSFLGEVGLTAMYRLGDHASVRTGYQVTWIDGVALAPDQITFTDVTPNSPGAATLNARSTLLYHGFHLGLEVVW